MFLTGSPHVITGIPVYANAVSDTGLSADLSASDETDNIGDTAANDDVDISIDFIRRH